MQFFLSFLPLFKKFVDSVLCISTFLLLIIIKHKTHFNLKVTDIFSLVVPFSVV